MTFTTGMTVEVLTGKFRGQTGTVASVRTDKDGTTRTQVTLAGGVFSYLPTSLTTSNANAAVSVGASTTASIAA